MKKTIALLMAVLAFAVSAMAITPSELVGTRWKSKKVAMPTGEDALNVNVVSEYTFDTENTLSDHQDATMSIFDKDSKMKIDVFITITAKSSYIADGDSITIQADMSTLKIECDDDDIRVTFPGGESNAIMESMIKGQMKSAVEAMRQQMEKSFNEPTVLKVKEFNGKKTLIETDGVEVEYSIKKI